MPFILTLHFVTDRDRDAFVERVVPHLRGRLVEPPADEVADAQGYQRIAIAVTSPSAAREVVGHAHGFLSHMKNARLVFAWKGVDGGAQYGEIVAGEARDADLLTMRIGAAAKAALDAEKAAEEVPEAKATNVEETAQTDSDTDPAT